MDPSWLRQTNGRPTMTWQSTFKEDLVDRGVDWNSVRAAATNRSRWRTLRLSVISYGELLLPIVMSRTGRSKCKVSKCWCAKRVNNCLTARQAVHRITNLHQPYKSKSGSTGG